MVLIYSIVQKSLFSFYMLVGIWKIENGNGEKTALWQFDACQNVLSLFFWQAANKKVPKDTI